MYLFLILALPLGALLLFVLAYSAEETETVRRAILRGLVAAIPTWLLARLLGNLVPAAWGSPLLLFHEWAARFLPYALVPALAYGVFYRYRERLPAGAAERRMAAFYAGALAPAGLGEMAVIWGNPGSYETLVLPVLICATALAAPAAVFDVVEEYGARRLLPILQALLFSLAAGAVRWLYLARFWPLALLLAGILAALAFFYGYPRVAKRPPSA